MSMKIRTEKDKLKKLIIELQKLSSKEQKGIWKRTAELLNIPKRRHVTVNVSKLSKLYKEGEITLIPGKVLGDGEFENKLNVAAYEYSPRAKEKIEKNGGKAMYIGDLIKENPKGTNVRIVR
jgi:large subunit ribosomal protein L18e